MTPAEASPRAETDLTIPELGFWRLVYSDYLAHQSDRAEPARRSALRFLPRLLYNPSLQLPFLVRVAQRGPHILRPIVRWLQVALFSSEIYWFSDGEDSIRIGPGLNMPHPINIVIGAGARIGSNVSIYNNVSMGTDQAGLPDDVWHRAARIGDGAVVYPYATVMGPYTVGAGAAVGMHVMVTGDIPPGALQTVAKLRERGEWDPDELSGRRKIPR